MHFCKQMYWSLIFCLLKNSNSDFTNVRTFDSSETPVKYCSYFHFIAEETEAQTGEVTICLTPKLSYFHCLTLLPFRVCQPLPGYLLFEPKHTLGVQWTGILLILEVWAGSQHHLHPQELVSEQRLGSFHAC